MIIKGKVQGVYFRQSTKDIANELGLCGWVCNRVDGSVEVCAQGAAVSIKCLLDFLHTGPPRARVDSMEVNEDVLLPSDREAADSITGMAGGEHCQLPEPFIVK